MKAVVALDLDQTLIYSERSAGRAKTDTDAWVEDRDGQPVSFMTARAHQLLSDLAARHHVVPVTTRTPKQYSRIRLPGAYPHAVCANGGVLLVHGKRDAAWDERIRQGMARVVPASTVRTRLAQVHTTAGSARCGRSRTCSSTSSRHTAARSPQSGSASSKTGPPHRGWTVSTQGRKVYVMPGRLLCKGDAALRIARHLGGPLLSAGDSLLDINLLGPGHRRDPAGARRAARCPRHELADTRH